MRISELTNLLDHAFNKFLLSLNINDFNILQNKINEARSFLAKTGKNQLLVREYVSKFSKDVNSILERIEKYKRDNFNDAISKEFKNDLYQTLIDHLDIEITLEEQKSALEKIDSLDAAIDEEEKKILDEKRNHFSDLSIKLDEFILGFNKIDDINIIASKKALNQIQKLKNTAFTLKVYFNDLQKKYSKLIEISELLEILDFVKSREWKQFQMEKQNLLDVLRKEM